MIKKILLSSLLLLAASNCIAFEKIELYVGEIKILKVKEIDRIAVGNPDVVSNSMLSSGQLLLIAESEGSSNVHIWFKDDSESDYMFHVTSTSSNLVTRKNEVENLLADIKGIDINIVGDRIVLTGQVAFGNETKIKTIQDAYEEVLVSTNFNINDLERRKNEIEDLLSDVEGLTVRIIGDKIALNGLIDNGFGGAIEIVQGVFPELLDLTQRASLDMNMPDNKMVLMNIKITEFAKNYLDSMGIEWDNSIAGPAAGATFTGIASRSFRATEQPATSFGGDLGITKTLTGKGYFGLITEITSRINFAVDSGDAIILAEPRLAARSGGEATFLSGGSFPIEISNINGTTIEFKEYGIKLSVSPVIDRNNNIRANVSTELSSINNAVAVNGVPGVNTRETQADVILKSGETLIMSGLLNQEASKDITGIKFLKDIPILGALFQSENFRDNKSELVIFVTPEVFDSSSDVNREAIEKAHKNIEEFLQDVDKDSLDIVY